MKEKSQRPTIAMETPATASKAQIHVCRRLGLQAVPPEERVALAISTLGQMPVHGARVERPENGTISWFFHCGDFSDAADFYQPVHAAHLQSMLPLVLGYLQLPPGTRFIVDDKGFEDVWQEGSPG